MKRFFNILKSLVLMISVIFSLTTATINYSYADTTTDANDGISKALCNVIKKLVGPIGKGIATVAIIFLCFLLFVGKISWGVAIATAIGVAAIPAAPYLVLFLSGESVTGDTKAALNNFCNSN